MGFGRKITEVKYIFIAFCFLKVLSLPISPCLCPNAVNTLMMPVSIKEIGPILAHVTRHLSPQSDITSRNGLFRKNVRGEVASEPQTRSSCGLLIVNSDKGPTDDNKPPAQKTVQSWYLILPEKFYHPL